MCTAMHCNASAIYMFAMPVFALILNISDKSIRKSWLIIQRETNDWTVFFNKYKIDGNVCKKQIRFAMKCLRVDSKSRSKPKISYFANVECTQTSIQTRVSNYAFNYSVIGLSYCYESHWKAFECIGDIQRRVCFRIAFLYQMSSYCLIRRIIRGKADTVARLLCIECMRNGIPYDSIYFIIGSDKCWLYLRYIVQCLSGERNALLSMCKFLRVSGGASQTSCSFRSASKTAFSRL